MDIPQRKTTSEALAAATDHAAILLKQIYDTTSEEQPVTQTRYRTRMELLQWWYEDARLVLERQPDLFGMVEAYFILFKNELKRLMSAWKRCSQKSS